LVETKCCKYKRFEGSWRQNTSITPDHPKSTYDFTGTYIEECKEAHPEEECPDSTYGECQTLAFSPPIICWSIVESSGEYDDRYFECECDPIIINIMGSGPYGSGVPKAVEDLLSQQDECICPRPRPKGKKHTIEEPPFPGGEADRVLNVTVNERVIKVKRGG